MPARFLVTGGTGFLGHHLLNTLKARGYFARSYSLDPPEKARDLEAIGIEIVRGDIFDDRTLRRALEGIDVVVHMAGEKRKPELCNVTNVEGTQSVLECCMKGNVKHLIHISSVGVVGRASSSIVAENAICHPGNPYEVSKYKAEEMALRFYHREALPITILRPANVFGDLDPDMHLLTLMRQIQKGHFRLIGRKDAWLNYVYAGDVAEACVLVHENPRAKGQVFNVSDPCRMSELIAEVSRILGIRNRFYTIPLSVAYIIAFGLTITSGFSNRNLPLSLSKIKAFRSRVIYSSEKIRSEFGAWPRFGWKEGVANTIAWFRIKGLL